MPNVLITGGAGFIGQNLVHAWRAARPADRLVVVDAMTYAANIRSLEPLIADRSIQFVNGDICDAALMQRLFEEHKFTRVDQLAAESRGRYVIAKLNASVQSALAQRGSELVAREACRRSGEADGECRERQPLALYVGLLTRQS